LAEKINYEAIIFETKSEKGNPFYHTNVMLSIGNEYVVVCKDAIIEKDRNRIL